MVIKNSVGIYIGRFQPLHLGHLSAIRDILKKVETLIIVLGSASSSRTIKNPWSATERMTMISSTIEHELGSDELSRTKFVFANDYLYNDNLWICAVQEKIDEITQGESDVILFGHIKDRSSFYLKLFPQWETSDIPFDAKYDATKVRDLYFKCDLLDLKNHVPETIFNVLRNDMMTSNSDIVPRDSFMSLKQEYEHIKSYKDMWNGAPFPPTFVTVDGVVIQSGHILVVRRKFHPGKGLIALPGGFINQNERILTSCIREIKEETAIRVQSQDLETSLVDTKVFDHPDRSLRGRTITHAFCFSLGHGPLPRVKGGDDAGKAWWMPLREVLASEPMFFEDHYHIISHFVNKF